MTEDFKSAVERFAKSNCTRKHFKLRILFVYPCALTVFRYSSENPDSECIDHELDALFRDLRTKTGTTNDITRKLSIATGAKKHRKHTNFHGLSTRRTNI